MRNRGTAAKVLCVAQKPAQEQENRSVEPRPGSTLPAAFAASRTQGLGVAIPEQTAQQQLDRQLDSLQLPAPLNKAVNKYLEAWDAVPSRYKIVLAGSMSFVICNMVSHAAAVQSPHIGVMLWFGTCMLACGHDAAACSWQQHTLAEMHMCP